MLHGTVSFNSGEKLYFRKFCLIIISLVLVFFEVQAQSGWTKKTNILTSRAGASASVVNNKIYVIGGSDVSLNDLAVNEVFDPSTNTWEIKAPMPTPRGFLLTAVVNDTIYAIGGGYSNSKNTVEAYDPATNSWTTKANMLSPWVGVYGAVANDKIYTMGGNYFRRNCFEYNPSTNTWTEKTSIPDDGGGALSATAYNGLIYAFGGSTYSPWAGLSTVHAYNPQTDTWTKKKDMPTSRFALRTFLVNGKIYALGGAQYDGNSLSTVEVYDPVTDTWERKSNMPISTSWFAGAVVNDKIYVISGTQTGWSSGWYDVWEYDPAFHTDIAAGNVSGTWTAANSPYHITGEITVPNGETLTIEPGAEVVFMGHYKFNVQGKLLAVGTGQDPILFTAEDKEAGWHGVRLINTPSTNDTSKIIYCSFKYGKANTGDYFSWDRDGGAIFIRGFDKVLVSNSLFEYNMTLGDHSSTGGAGVCIFNASPIVTKNTFTNNNSIADPGAGGIIKIDSTSNAIISNNVISNNKCWFGTIICAYGTDNKPTISGNIISNNIVDEGAAGILVFFGSNARIENNVITYNQVPSGNYSKIGGGIGCLDSANPVVINNTIAYNSADYGGGIYFDSNSDGIFINNILYGNTATSSGNQVFINDAGSDPVFKYCDVQGGKEGFGGSGAGALYTGLYQNNIDNDPSFTNAVLDYYRLSDLSPCIGAGIDSIEVAGNWIHAPLFCIMGNPRPSPAGSKPDVGAYENLLALPVPVELTLFTATANSKEVTLNWSTATELNNQGFEVQRKFGANDFVTIGSVKGHGTTTSPNQYSYVDKLIDPGKYFYRLKQIDFNGTFEYSNVIEVDVRMLDNFTLEQNYPNPFNPTTTIGYVLQEKSNAKLTLLNSLGEEIAVLVNEEQDKGYHKVEFDGSKLSSGVYYYRLVAGNFNATRKLLLLK